MTPHENATHLIRPRRALAGDPLPQPRDRYVADFRSSGLKRDPTVFDVSSELHRRDIPHNGEHSQPRFGEGAVSQQSGKCPAMGNRIKHLRTQRRWTHEVAAEASGMSRSQFIKLERGERRLTSTYIDQIARAFGVSPAAIISEVVDNGEDVPIVGLAGAGPLGSVQFAHTDGELGFGPPSPNSSGATVALEVSGDSMRGIASDGWLVYYDEEQVPPRDDMIGELCVVGLDDDRVLVKVLQPGRGPGLFDLESFNAPVMRDVPVRWASLVTSIIPRKPARTMTRRQS